MKNLLLLLMLPMLALSSCVGSKKYKAQVKQYEDLKTDCDKIKYQLSACLSEKETQGVKLKSAEDELANLRQSSNQLLQQLSEMSVLTTSQSESINNNRRFFMIENVLIKWLNNIVI